MFCIECGEQYENNDKFCWKCGAKLPEKRPAEKPVQKKPDIKTTIQKKATTISDYSSGCSNINNANCRICTQKESIDGEGYFWCKKHKKSFKSNWIQNETEQPKEDISKPTVAVQPLTEVFSRIFKPLQEQYQSGYVVTDSCVNCGSCESECSVGAISEKNGKRYIDHTLCVSCGACAGACPTESIVDQ